MDNNQIALQMLGPEEEDGDVKLEVFLRQVAILKRALYETDRLLSGGESVYFRVSGLSHSSPATIELEARPKEKADTHFAVAANSNFAVAVVDAFYNNIKLIQEGDKLIPVTSDVNTLMAYKDLTSLFGKGINGLSIARKSEEMSLSPSFARKIDTILGPDLYEKGSVTGHLHQLNLHNSNVFTIYPTLASRPKVRCLFPKELRQAVVNAVDRYVTVYGRTRYKMHLPHPYEVRVDDIEVHPPEDELPTFQELLGVAPNATNGVPSEEFVSAIRSGWSTHNGRE